VEYISGLTSSSFDIRAKELDDALCEPGQRDQVLGEAVIGVENALKEKDLLGLPLTESQVRKLISFWGKKPEFKIALLALQLPSLNKDVLLGIKELVDTIP
jgi:hypothetical protein